MPRSYKSKDILIGTCVAVAALAAVAFFSVVDPAQCQWAPKCMFHALTGLQCPGCGFSRAAHAVLHGHWGEALAYNYFFVVSIPYLMAVVVATLLPQGARWRRYALHRYAAWAYVALFGLWWVVRNVAGI